MQTQTFPSLSKKSNRLQELPPLQDMKSPIALLQELVEINSPTNHLPGVNIVQRRVAAECEKMGLQPRLISHPSGQAADLLFAELKTGASQTVTAVCHADTVFDTSESMIDFFIEGERASGPGVADNKGGIVVALHTFRRYLQECAASGRPPRWNLQLLCSPNEETGSHGFTDFFHQVGLGSELVLGFEPSTADGSIIDQRSGNRWYHMEVHGIAAHAGRAAGEEINAAHELMAKLQALLELKKEHDDLKINVASLGGGSERYNIVCDNATAKIDIRFSKRATREAFHQKMIDVTAHSFFSANTGQKPQSRWRMDDDCPPLEKTSRSEEKARQVQEIIQSVEDRPIGVQQVGGAADLNYLSHPENIAIDGLGPVGGGMHTDTEYIELSSLQTRPQAVAEFLLKTVL